MDFSSLFPALQPWVENLARVWPAPIIKPQFAIWEVGHLLSLFILAGAIIMVNLRLLGAGLTSQSPSSIEQTVRPWLNIGVIGVLVTGVLIGMTNAEKLYYGVAFFVKMIALVAAIIFTYAVTIPIAKADGKVGGRAKIAGAIAGAIWLVAVWIFSTAEGINPGAVHLIIAGGLITFAATGGKTRWLLVGGLCAMVLAQQVVTHVMITDRYDLRLAPINIWFSRIEALWIFAIAAFQVVATRKTAEHGALAQIAAYASILVWVTVAAAGRWIGFS